MARATQAACQGGLSKFLAGFHGRDEQGNQPILQPGQRAHASQGEAACAHCRGHGLGLLSYGRDEAEYDDGRNHDLAREAETLERRHQLADSDADYRDVAEKQARGQPGNQPRKCDENGLWTREIPGQ